jgi:hypothetical protein
MGLIWGRVVGRKLRRDVALVNGKVTDPAEYFGPGSDRVVGTATVPAARPIRAVTPPVRCGASLFSGAVAGRPLPALEAVGMQTLRRSHNPADRNEEIHL